MWSRRRGAIDRLRVVSESDRVYWDRRWAEAGPAPVVDRLPDPPAFADLVASFPTRGLALDVACGRGRGTAWIARRGMDVCGIDISPVAIDLAAEYVDAMGVAARCTFVVADLDTGLPPGPPVDLVFSYLFWSPELTVPLVERLRPGGLLAVCHVSEADVGPGDWCVPASALSRAFSAIRGLEILDDRDADGIARVLGRRSTP